MKSYFPDINVWVALAYRGHQHHPVAAPCRPMLAMVMHATWQQMLDSGPPEDKARTADRGRQGILGRGLTKPQQ